MVLIYVSEPPDFHLTFAIDSKSATVVRYTSEACYITCNGSEIPPSDYTLRVES
jgi:hypothetical protein